VIEPPKISKKTPESKAKDFAFLKEEGIRYIQKVAGSTWTDYNAHDPGVTILEQLAYAINDLAYRASFDIKDLLAEDSNGKGKQEHFFTPREVLTSNPVNISDYRKLLIDIEGIKNAWLEPRFDDNFFSDGSVFYKGEHAEELQYTETGDEEVKVKLYGLYDILLEFENDEKLGDLNSNKVKEMFEISNTKSELHGLKLEIAAEYPYWDDHRLDHVDKDTIKNNLLSTEITFVRRSQRFVIKTTSNEDERFEVYEAVSRQYRADLVQELQGFYNDALDKLSEKYASKLQLIENIVKEVTDRIHKHRNLCEDFIQVRSLKVKEIALCLKIDLENTARPDWVLANIFNDLNKFFSPALRFHTLEDLLSRDIPVDEIFEGPALNHGFITDDQLSITDRRHIIYTSDLINVIADVKGVIFINEVEIAKRTNGEFIDQVEGDQWHLELDEVDQENDFYIPRLNLSKTNIKFYKDGIPVSSNKDKVYEYLDQLESRDDTPIKSPILDIQPVQGEVKDVAEYPSIQSDFPNAYNINDYGVPPTASDEKKAKVQQLKGYLLFFEQLLANYLTQLSHVGELFSLDTTVDRTYFVNDLYSVPNLAHLIYDFIEESNLPNNPKDDDLKAFKQKWDAFVSDDQNSYITKLKSIAEKRHIDNSLFIDRRNRFLDHLMARFSENFGEYAMIMHSIDRDVSGMKLIEDKALLLKDYPKISANRGRAFDYHKKNNDHHQFTGLEMRVARLLGIDLENLTTKGTIVEKYVDQAGEHRFRIKDKTGEIILNSEEGYETEQVLNNIIELVLDAAMSEVNYQRKVDKRGKFYFNLLVESGQEIIARSQEYYDTEEERDEEIQNVIEHISKLDEKLHVIEHILLRPKINTDNFLAVNSPADGSCCPGTNDPYSFTISVFLPSWPARFRDLEFRKYVEKRIRLETPAHIFPKICWISIEQMAELEDKLSKWREALSLVDFNLNQLLGNKQFETFANKALQKSFELSSKEAPEDLVANKTRIRKQMTALRKEKRNKKRTAKDKGRLQNQIDLLAKVEKLKIRSDALNELIEVMSSLRNVYPEATLYDCHESEKENPVSLNRTILGTFKPLENE